MCKNVNLSKNMTRRVITFAITLTIIFLLSACGHQEDGKSESTVSYDGKNMHLELAPPAIFKNVAINDLKANITLNGGDPIPLNVALDNTISGTLETIDPGDYVLVITYYVERSLMLTKLATVTKTITVTSGEVTVVTITDADLIKEIDDDRDGYTNLAEVRSNTNPHDAADKPGEAIGFAVADSSFGDSTSPSYRMRHQVGEAIVGNAKSVNYEVKAGFPVQ